MKQRIADLTFIAMNKKHITYYILFILIYFFTNAEIFSQKIINKQPNLFIQNNLILSIEGGVSYGYTDYRNSLLGPALRGSLEYYPVIFGNGRLGIKVFGGGLKLNLEDDRVSTSTNDGSRDIPAKIFTDMIQIGGLVTFGYSIADFIIPSVSLGTAYLNFSPKYENGTILPFNSQKKYEKTKFAFVIGGDAKIKISESISANLSLNYYLPSTDYLDDVSASTNDDSFITLLVGLSYAFIGNFDSDNDGITDKYDICPDTPQGVIVDEAGCPIDSDNDGIPDYLDSCSDTPPGVKVDEYGCPIDSDKDGVPDYLDKCSDTPTGVVVNANGCSPDEDNDGVPDYLDKCPDTPENAMVDQFGCPLDSDKDGVPDYKDNCPDTPINTKVDSNGCTQEVTQQEETFYQFILRGDDTFESNSTDLIQLAKFLLDEIAFYIKNQVGSKWIIEGHMDNQGSASSLKKLSYDRAKAVYDYLISQGLSPDQFTISGLGNSSPIANNNTPEGRSTNRRIIIIRED